MISPEHIMAAALLFVGVINTPYFRPKVMLRDEVTMMNLAMIAGVGLAGLLFLYGFHTPAGDIADEIAGAM
jgi:hypothetical protein